ncbi:MAG: complex I NDUFA9 subunit family protein [Alphaproteobacteria bacterium]|nr:complex I NDUFA9 subunit family protein [Alphaproteobacteria bacterium]
MARRLVTMFGGSGFIGRHLVRKLAAEGWRVRVAGRDPEGALFLKPMGDVGQIALAQADVRDAASVAQAVAGADAVVNLVAILHETPWRTFPAIHVEGAANIARAAAKARVARLVHVSAIGADAESPAAYGRTKAAGEQAARAAFPGATIVRPSIVFGAEDQFFNRFAAMARVSPALPVIAGTTRFQPVFVEDVAEAIRRCLADPATAGRTFELGGPRTYTFRELLAYILRVIRRRRCLVPVPGPLAMLQASVLELLPVPPLTRDQVLMLRTDNVVAQGAEGFATLGIRPAAVEAVVPEYLARYRKPVPEAA